MPVLLLAAYATGIAMARLVAPWGITGLSITTALLFLAWVSLRHSRLATLPLLGMLLLAGLTNAIHALNPPDKRQHIRSFAYNQPIAVEARVVLAERRSIGGYRLVADALRIFEKDTAKRTSGKILLIIEQGDSRVRPGQIIRWRSKLRRPSAFGNPGEFDYPLYLAARGIHVTGFIPSDEDLVIVINHPQRQEAFLGNLRHNLAASIQSSIPQEQAGLLQSLLLGIRGGITPAQRKIIYINVIMMRVRF